MNTRLVFYPIVLLALAQLATLTAAVPATAESASASSLRHTVAAKETLYGIARRYSVSLDSLKKANGITDDLIHAGQILVIPAAALPVETSAEVFGNLSEEDRWKLQIFLDRAQFAPGKVDGLIGEFTVKAAERWIAAKAGRSLGSLLADARQEVIGSHISHKIPAVAAKFVGTVPTDLPGKAGQKSLPYESLAELVAERYHTDLSTLRRLNPHLDLSSLDVGDRVTVPAVSPFLIESWPAVQPRPSPPSGTRLHFQHAARLIEVIDSTGSVLATFPITVGAKPEYLRTGTWFIQGLATNPTFLWDDTMLKEGRKGTKQFLLPPGPNNPVGILWLDLEPLKGPEAHIGIHGTNEPARIGRNHSSGCIRLANWDIVRLARLVGKGTLVTWQAPATVPALVMNRRP